MAMMSSQEMIAMLRAGGPAMKPQLDKLLRELAEKPARPFLEAEGERIAGRRIKAARKERIVKAAVDRLNKTERFYLQGLELKLRAGQIRRYWVQAITFRIGDDCRYTPDFVVETLHGVMVLVETKGFLRDDALVKFKTTLEQFPFFQGLMVGLKKGHWHVILRTKGAAL